MREFSRYIVTSALPYANGPLHIGHLAGAYLSGDVFVRFLRLMGKDVLYVCGSDEHGAAITMKAMKDKVSPQEIIDKYHNQFKDTFAKMGISFDIYHRTSSALHHETSQDFFTELYNKGEFQELESAQYFDEEANQFLADRFIKGTCPKCSYTDAYGDQCEQCGSSLSPTELINPRSVLSGAIPIMKNTKHWYLPLDKYEAWLREWVSTGVVDGITTHDPSDWKNHVLGQCKSWLDSGLQPRAMTRDLDWGIDVPHHIAGHEGKKLYVWMDAPIGYISATKQWAADNGKDWKDYWCKEDSALYHFIGKDNIVFHCLIFPAMLKAHGQFNLPYNVPANQFMNLEGQKISTSRNWAVWVHEYLESFPDKVDELRYCMIKNMPELKDSEFTWKSYQESVNNELVANLANFVNRVVVLTNKFYDGIVPDIDENITFLGSGGIEFSEEEYEYFETELIVLHDEIQELNECLRNCQFKDGLKKLMDISKRGNQLLQYNEPWKLVKTEPETTATIINLCLQYATALSVCCRPFMPFASNKLRTLLCLPQIEDKGEINELLDTLCESQPLIFQGHKIGEPIHLFTRIDDEVIESQSAKLASNLPAVATEKKSETELQPKQPPLKPEIGFEDFIKLDLRTATILTAEKVEKSDKLLKLTLDLGFEQRTVVSGIAAYYKAEDIIGKKVTLLANLAPKKIKGIESKGMILMAADSDGKLHFVCVNDDCENGASIS